MHVALFVSLLLFTHAMYEVHVRSAARLAGPLTHFGGGDNHLPTCTQCTPNMHAKHACQHGAHSGAATRLLMVSISECALECATDRHPSTANNRVNSKLLWGDSTRPVETNAVAYTMSQSNGSGADAMLDARTRASVECAIC